MDYRKVPCVIIRGGTSKGVFFHDRDLPEDPGERDRLILSAFGSPDARQIDGLGGADPLTSKLAIIRPSVRPGVDIDYTFGQVSLSEAAIDYSVNCGNISAGAAVFAVDEGLVRAEEPVTIVRIFNTNTGALIHAAVEVRDGKALATGEFSIDGVPGKGSMIELNFMNIAGASTGAILPTGKAVDDLLLSNGRKAAVSIVDAGNLYAIVRSGDMGLKGDEAPGEIESSSEVMASVKEVFELSSKLLSEKMGSQKEFRIKKLALVSPREGAPFPAKGPDLISRIISSNGKAHRAYAVTGAICVGSAAYLEGSVVDKTLAAKPQGEISIGHPQGTIELEIRREPAEKGALPASAVIRRTARRIMEGFVYARI